MTPETANSWAGLVRLHLGWYPLSELRDIYKLIYQGVMGAEHILTSPEGFTTRLNEEYERLVPDRTLRTTEPVRPDLNLVRVNLRAYKARCLQLDLLIPGLLDSGKIVHGDMAALQAAWGSFCEAVELGQFQNYTVDSLRQFSRWIEELGYPAVHHSETYRAAYLPSYRLMVAEYIPKAGLTDAS